MYAKLMIIGSICFLLIQGLACGNTLHVPDQYPTIQDAIDVAVNGDEVLVARGIYLESIRIIGKHITLRSEDGPNMTCIWGGNKPGTVVEVRSGWKNPATAIDGFEITSRYGPYYYAAPASGITCVECSMKVINCNVNGCDYHGIECYEAFVEIENTLVLGNGDDPFALGAGIYGNTVDFSILNCTISDNENKSGGAGICIEGSIKSSTIKNTILWNNRSTNVASGSQIWLSKSAMLDISYSDVQDGQAMAYAAPGCSLKWGAGMMDADPLFVHMGTDFHLRATSPCIDAGDSSGAPLADFENDPRSGVDIGADEFHLHLYQYGLLEPGEYVYIKITGQPNATPVSLIIGHGLINPPLPTQYGDFFLKFPVHIFTYAPMPSTGFTSLIGYAPPSLTPGTEFYFQGFVQDALSNFMVMTVVEMYD